MKIKSSTKQVFKQSRIIALAAAMALASCKGEDGDIGPKGDAGTPGATGAAGAPGTPGAGFDKAFENGFVKGTIKGTRRDGTAFEEPFEYKMTTDQSYFEKISPTEHTLSLSRSKGVAEYENYISLNLTVTNKDQAGATAKISGAYLEFSKMLANRDLFYLNAGTNLSATSVTLPMSRDNNATYKLVTNGMDLGYYEDTKTGEEYQVFKDTDGNEIYFSNSPTRDAATGSNYYPFKYIVNSAGTKSVTSSVWSNVRIIYNSNHRKIFTTSTGTVLSETFEVPGDIQEVTNFTYNATTGLVTFDYKINVSEFRGFDIYYDYNVDGDASNSTMHSLEIKGSVSATVFNGAVMRKSAQ